MSKDSKIKSNSFKVKLNNKQVLAYEGETVLELAKRNGIYIPSFCHHPDLTIKANCRVCVVEIKDSVKLKTSCSTYVSKGMEIITDSERVKKSRETNLELIYASHVERCVACSYRYDCNLLSTARDYKLKITRFKDRKKKRKTYKFANAVEVDGSQCIDCRNCIEACQLQGINYLEIDGRGIEQEVKPTKDKLVSCVYCGQCALHCPVASAQEQDQSIELEKILKLKNKIVVAQFAPAVRVSLGESFALPYGYNCEAEMIASLKKLGFNYITDVNFGADITTMVEAEEFVERLNDKKAVWPMMTSCCPAWVAYVEFYHPELIPNLTTARSPHLHSAGMLKTMFSQKKNINPKDILVVSIMPCTAKKYEAVRKELYYKNNPLVDYVLTTRELAFLMKKNNIDLKSAGKGKLDNLFNEGSGAAAIYGASGGVMESALRTVAHMTKTAKQKKQSLEYKAVRGLSGLKKSEVSIGGKNYKIAVINGLGNIDKILPKLKNYHYVEVMACPGGCIGGGGQPIPTTIDIRKKRLDGLYKIDKQRKPRVAHENKDVLKCLDYIKENKLSHDLLHTSFKKSKGTILNTTKDNN